MDSRPPFRSSKLFLSWGNITVTLCKFFFPNCQMKYPGCVGRLRLFFCLLVCFVCLSFLKRGPAVQQGFAQLCHTLSGFGVVQKWSTSRPEPETKHCATSTTIISSELSFLLLLSLSFFSTSQTDFLLWGFSHWNCLVEAFGPAGILE